MQVVSCVSVASGPAGLARSRGQSSFRAPLGSAAMSLSGTPLRAVAQGSRGSRSRECVTTRAAFRSLFFKKPAPKAIKRETIIPEPSYNIPIALLGMAGAAGYEGATPAAVLFGVLGLFLARQAGAVKFVFDDEGLEVVVGKTEEITENRFFPVLVYFKETQTKPEGQIHFFPIIFNGKQLYDVMQERCGPSKTSGPKK
eukprot:jgi/Tetstr1/421466/TSEL_012415.t1